MKILILSQYWAPENGVPQRRWSWLAGLLSDLGHEVTVIAPPPHYDRKISFSDWVMKVVSHGFDDESIGESGEHIVRSPFLPSGKSLTARAMNQGFVGVGIIASVLTRRGALKGYTPDLIIGTVPAIPISFAVWMVGRIYRRPYIVDLRDAWPDLLEQAESWNAGMGKTSIRQKILSMGPLQVISWLTKRIMNRSLRNARGIIATSERLAENLGHRLRVESEGIVPEIVTIRNVFPPETHFEPKDFVPSQARELRVLYAGTIGRAQNLRNALRAVEIAKGRGAKISLRVVGSGAEKGELRKLASHLSDSVSFESVLPASELSLHYQWADTALVHLSDWEPLERTVPSKVYELLDLGLHISGVVAGETAEIVSSLNAGDVVEPNKPEQLADLWIELSENRANLNTSRAGREWVKFQREQVVPATLRTLLIRVQEH